MRENLRDIYQVFTSDEILLRLLYYVSSQPNDDPLSSTKPNILDMDVGNKWEIIKDRIKRTPKVDDLNEEYKICRILVYPGRRRGDSGNYISASQDININIVVHIDIDDIDFRRTWIADRIDDLIANLHITGNGMMVFRTGDPLSLPKGYVGYNLVYTFGSTSNTTNAMRRP